MWEVVSYGSVIQDFYSELCACHYAFLTRQQGRDAVVRFRKVKQLHGAATSLEN